MISVGGWRGDDKTNASGPPKKPKPAGGNQVNIAKPTNNNTLSNRQTQANYNYNQAMAHYQGDPRYAGKQYQRAGMSSSAGTNYLGSAQAANQYAQNMAAAEAGRMQDAYTNADIALNDAAQRSQFGLALTGLQEDAAQREYMNQLRNQQNAMNFMGNMMSPFGGGGPSNLLSGLL